MRRGCLTASDAAATHPRHLVLATAVAGLLLGGHTPASVVAVAAVLLAVGAVTIPLVSGPPAGVGLAAVLLLAAVVADARGAALDRTALGPDLGHAVSGEATLLSAPRAAALGGRRAIVRWRDERVLLRLAAWDASVAPGVGDIVHVQGRLLPPDRAAHSLRAHATLRADHVVATGRRRGGAVGAVDAVRRRAQRALEAPLPTAEGTLLVGMVLGQDEGLPDELRAAFVASGLTHLTAASGQNIMLLAALALGLCVAAGVGVRGRWLLVLGLIALYVPLAGSGPSIQRAGIMGAATLAAAFAGRPASRWYAVLLAAAVTLALDPRSASEPGWQLSFAAVLGIALLARPAGARLARLGAPAAICEAVAVTVAATLATAPVIALRFDSTSLVSLPANVLAAPAVAPAMWLGMAAAAVGQVAPGLAHPLAAVAGLPVGYLAWLARTASAMPGAAVGAPAGLVSLFAGLAAVAILGEPRAPRAPSVRARRRRLAVGAVAAVLVLGVLAAMRAAGPTVGPPPPGDFRVTALDIGQGDATLLQAGAHAVLVDAGPPGAPLVARLRAAGVDRLDALVVTHPQADHDGGAPAVLSALPVGVLLDGRGGDRSPTSVAIDAPARRRATQVVAAHAGQVVRAGPLTLDILWPPAEPGPSGGDPNDRAVVAVARAYGAQALLTADAESDVLARLDLPPVDVLKVSHHGSADAGLAQLLDRLHPRVALVEVGRHNTYGHPTPETMRTLTASVPEVRRTDREGTVRVDLGAGHVTVAAERGGGGDAGV